MKSTLRYDQKTDVYLQGVTEVTQKLYSFSPPIDKLNSSLNVNVQMPQESSFK